MLGCLYDCIIKIFVDISYAEVSWLPNKFDTVFFKKRWKIATQQIQLVANLTLSLENSKIRKVAIFGLFMLVSLLFTIFFTTYLFLSIRIFSLHSKSTIFLTPLPPLAPHCSFWPYPPPTNYSPSNPYKILFAFSLTPASGRTYILNGPWDVYDISKALRCLWRL